jgi:hypothetical protein
MGRRPPTRSNPVAPPLQRTLYRGRRQSVDRYVFLLNGNHLSLRPRPTFISIFYGACVGAPNKETNTAPPNPTTSALHKHIEGGGTMIWLHR